MRPRTYCHATVATTQSPNTRSGQVFTNQEDCKVVASSSRMLNVRWPMAEKTSLSLDHRPLIIGHARLCNPPGGRRTDFAILLVHEREHSSDIMSLAYNTVPSAIPPLGTGVLAMKSCRISRHLLGAAAVAAFWGFPHAAEAQVVYTPALAPVYFPPRNDVQQPRDFVNRPAGRHHGRTGADLIRFRGGYVNGRNPYWPTGRNIPMAKPWLSAR